MLKTRPHTDNLRAFQTDDYTWLEMHRDDAKRLISHLMTKGYWFTAFQTYGVWTVIISSAVELDKITRKINVTFEVLT